MPANQLTKSMQISSYISKITRLFVPQVQKLSGDVPRFDAYTYLWSNSRIRETMKSGLPLHFSKYFCFGHSMNNILKLTGKADYIMENRPYDLDIVVFLQKIKDMDVRFELHFQMNKLFFISYTYFNITDAERSNVIKSLCEKYKVPMTGAEFQQIIVDIDGNALLFENGDNFSVNYLAPSSKVDSLSKALEMDKKKAI